MPWMHSTGELQARWAIFYQKSALISVVTSRTVIARSYCDEAIYIDCRASTLAMTEIWIATSEYLLAMTKKRV